MIGLKALSAGIRVIAAVGVVALIFSAGSAQAGLGSGDSFTVCGKWVLKMRDFGKIRVNDYNSWVPVNFQRLLGTEGDVIRPELLFFFNSPTRYTVVYTVIDQMGNPVNPPFGFILVGDYEQNGKKLKFSVDASALAALGDTFAETAVNSLFGDRSLVTDIPFTTVRNPDNLRFKGRLKSNGDRLKVKFKANMLYDIQFMNNSEFADIFDAKGRLKLRADSKRCSN